MCKNSTTSTLPSIFASSLLIVLLFVLPPMTQQSVCGVETCVLHPELTQGPYWVDLELVRQDITEGKPGVPLTLTMTVVNSNTCEVVPNAGVELWHCDSMGIYSHFEQASNNVQNPQTDNTTYLRGIQMTDQGGVAVLKTVYPGWYNGRTIHIHLKVHLGGEVVNVSVGGDGGNGGNVSVLLMNSTTAHTGQLFMNDSMNAEIAKLSPYSSHGDVTLLKLDEDDIYLGGGSYGLLELKLVDPALGFSGGLVGNVTVAVDISANRGDSSSSGGGSGGGNGGPGMNFTGSAPPMNSTGTRPLDSGTASTVTSPSSTTIASTASTSSTTASPSTASPSSTTASSASKTFLGFAAFLLVLVFSLAL